MEPAPISSEKPAPTLEVSLIPSALLAGFTLVTVGGVVSGGVRVAIRKVKRLVKNPVLPGESSLTKRLHSPLGSVPSKAERKGE
jgi:hypothetical protein